MARSQTAPTASPWEREAKESAKAFEAFSAYRDMGPVRSINNVAERLGKHSSLISGWSSKHSWVKRVRAWDDHQHELSMRSARNRGDQSVRMGEALDAQLAALSLPAAELMSRLEKSPGLLAESDAHELIELAIKTTRALADLLRAERTARLEGIAREEEALPEAAAIIVRRDKEGKTISTEVEEQYVPASASAKQPKRRVKK
jgi:hypothetical protein